MTAKQAGTLLIHNNHPTTNADANNDPPDTEPARDEVARNAYALYEKEGRPQGRDKQNWLEAEAQMSGHGSDQHQGYAGTRMSIVETLQRPMQANGFARIQHRLPRLRRKETESKERNVTAQATASVTAVRREREPVLEAEANAVVAESPYHAIRRVSCEVRTCVIILRGRVPSFYMKQIAQTVVRHLLESGMVINNQLEVDRT